MTTSLRDRWVAELRSGNWPQARQQLGYVTLKPDGTCVGGLCCLGVLTVIADDTHRWKGNNENYYPEPSDAMQLVTPTRAPDGDGTDIVEFAPYTLMDEDVQACFARLNDTWQLNFEQIADIVELALNDDLTPRVDMEDLERETERPTHDSVRLIDYLKGWSA